MDKNLESMDLFCSECGGKLIEESSNIDNIVYGCGHCGRKWRTPADMGNFRAYRRDMNSKLFHLTGYDKVTRTEDNELRYALEQIRLKYKDFVDSDPQYHLYRIALETERFNTKFNENDRKSQFAVTAFTAVMETESFPIDMEGKQLREAYKAWRSKEKAKMPGWAKALIILGSTLLVLGAVAFFIFGGRTLAESDTGITVSVSFGDFGVLEKWGVSLKAKKLDETSREYGVARILLKDESERFSLYDIALLSGGAEIQPNGEVRVSIPTPDGYNEKNLRVYHISESGQLEPVAAEVSSAKGTVSFTASHFSLYVVAERPYKVSFEDADVKTQYVLWGGVASKPETPSRTGYTFLGWFVGDAEWSFETEFITEDITVTAKWSANKYELSFDPGEGTLGNESDIKTVTFGNEETLPTPTRYGYKFLGWYDSERNRYESGMWQAASDLDLVAEWEIGTYNVIYHSAGKTVLGASAKYKDTVSVDLVPDRAGADFVGWFSDPEFKNPISGEQIMPGEDLHVYAKWNLHTFSATVYYNNGMSVGAKITSYTVEDLPDIIDPKYSKYPEYISFLGWFEDSAMTKPFANDLIENPRNITLYAKWEAATIYVGAPASGVISPSSGCDFAIVDMSSSAANVAKTLTVESGMREVVFIGSPDKTFSALAIKIANYSDGDTVTVRLVNFKYTANGLSAFFASSDSGTDYGTNVNLISEGESLIGNAYGAGSAISGIRGTLTILGSSLTVNGGNATGGAAGGNGIAVSDLVIDIDKLTVNAGVGGTGTKGTDATGKTETGGKGGAGGVGGIGIIADSVLIKSGKVVISGGDGGVGGRGGKGDEGGLFDNDGDGGAGGVGGNGGYAIKSDSVKAESGATVSVIGGNGGKGGDGGNGGSGGINESKGGKGATGGEGSPALSGSSVGSFSITNGTNGDSGKNGTGT